MKPGFEEDLLGIIHSFTAVLNPCRVRLGQSLSFRVNDSEGFFKSGLPLRLGLGSYAWASFTWFKSCIVSFSSFSPIIFFFDTKELLSLEPISPIRKIKIKIPCHNQDCSGHGATHTNVVARVIFESNLGSPRV